MGVETGAFARPLKMHSRVPQSTRGQRKEATGAIFGGEKCSAASGEQLITGARYLGEGADLDGEHEALQGAQDALPVERAGIPLPLVEVDVEMAHDAVKVERSFQGVHDHFPVAFGNLGFEIGEDAQQGPRQGDYGFVLFGTEIIGVVPEAIDDHVVMRPCAPLGREPVELGGVVTAAVADLHTYRYGVLLLGMVGALDQIEGLINRPIGVDHEVR